MGYSRTKAKVRAFLTRRNARELVLTFDQCLLQRALDDANGVVETAAIMLMSAEQVEVAGGATGVDLDSNGEGDDEAETMQSGAVLALHVCFKLCVVCVY